MGWTVDTYERTRMTGQPSNYRTCMFELCRALRERMSSNLTDTPTGPSMYKADGTGTTNITMADLYLMRMVGSDNYFIENLKRIQAQIVAMASSSLYMVGPTSGTPYSLATLEAAIGSSLQEEPRSHNDARFWQAQQDALDKLIYPRYSFFIAGVGTDEPDRYYYHGTNSIFADCELPDGGWSSRYDSTTDESASNTDIRHHWIMTHTDNVSGSCPNGENNVAQMYHRGKFRVDKFLALDDALSPTRCSYRIMYRNMADIAIEIGVGSASHTMSSGFDEGTAELEGASNEFSTTVATTHTLTFNTAEPATSPFSFSGPGLKDAVATLTHVEMTTDLSPILTDQA